MKTITTGAVPGTTAIRTVCGNCEMPIHYTVNSVSGLWYHDHSGKWSCDYGLGDANTSQKRIPKDA